MTKNDFNNNLLTLLRVTVCIRDENTGEMPCRFLAPPSGNGIAVASVRDREDRPSVRPTPTTAVLQNACARARSLEGSSASQSVCSGAASVPPVNNLDFPRLASNSEGVK